MPARTRFVRHPRFGYDRTLRRLTTRNDTEYLLSFPENARLLREALADSIAGRNLIPLESIDFLRGRLRLGEED